MIVRTDADGSLLLIGQTDHSCLVDQVAAHWGNTQFETLKPYESVVRAATLHDYGWLGYETSPPLNPETGEPYQFLNVRLTGTQLNAYQWSLDWLADIDRYAGLITNMHRTGLWKGRYKTITHSGGYDCRTLSQEIEELIARNEAWQERERALLDQDTVWTNYRLMQVWDLLGLYFCCQDPYDDGGEPVPARYGNDEGLRLSLKPVTARKVAFDPYLFDVRPAGVQLASKRLPQTTFPDRETFRRAYFRVGEQADGVQAGLATGASAIEA